MIDPELIGATEELNGLYVQRPITKQWNDPTREEMIRSLNKAHEVNKALIRNLDKGLQAVRGANRRIKLLLWAFGVTWVIFGGILKWLIPYAIKGMLK